MKSRKARSLPMHFSLVFGDGIAKMNAEYGSDSISNTYFLSPYCAWNTNIPALSSRVRWDSDTACKGVRLFALFSFICLPPLQKLTFQLVCTQIEGYIHT